MIEIFTFGSNYRGAHLGGAAKHALDNCGAIFGQGVGLQGNSYAIPTLDENFKQLPLEVIARHVEDFKTAASIHDNMTFRVTAIGCGIAGFKPEQIAPMFADAPVNCILPDEFKQQLIKEKYTLQGAD